MVLTLLELFSNSSGKYSVAIIISEYNQLTSHFLVVAMIVSPIQLPRLQVGALLKVFYSKNFIATILISFVFPLVTSPLCSCAGNYSCYGEACPFL